MLLTQRPRALRLLPSAPPPSPSLPHDTYQLSHPGPHPKIQKCHLTTTSSHHPTHSMIEIMLSPLPHLTSRLSVSSWPPKLPRSAFDARWPPLETWHLEYIRIASSGGICPLTCAKVGAERGAWVSAINAASTGAVAAAEYTTALSIAPSRRLPTLTPAASSRDPKMSSHHHLLSLPLSLNDS